MDMQNGEMLRAYGVGRLRSWDGKMGRSWDGKMGRSRVGEKREGLWVGERRRVMGWQKEEGWVIGGQNAKGG